jgi:hypothetical protein
VQNQQPRPKAGACFRHQLLGLAREGSLDHLEAILQQHLDKVGAPEGIIGHQHQAGGSMS